TCRFPSSERCVPQQWTSTSISLANSRLRYSTCTPAPPYTFGGYSRVINPTRIALSQLPRNSILPRGLSRPRGRKLQSLSNWTHDPHHELLPLGLHVASASASTTAASKTKFRSSINRCQIPR